MDEHDGELGSYGGGVGKEQIYSIYLDISIEGDDRGQFEVS